jgi:hypothetical protein
MLRKLLLVATISTALISISGCVTLKKSRVPEFLEELSNHEFNQEERQTIGEILEYVNQLENQ